MMATTGPEQTPNRPRKRNRDQQQPKWWALMLTMRPEDKWDEATHEKKTLANSWVWPGVCMSVLVCLCVCDSWQLESKDWETEKIFKSRIICIIKLLIQIGNGAGRKKEKEREGWRVRERGSLVQSCIVWELGFVLTLLANHAHHCATLRRKGEARLWQYSAKRERERKTNDASCCNILRDSLTLNWQ